MASEDLAGDPPLTSLIGLGRVEILLRRTEFVNARHISEVAKIPIGQSSLIRDPPQINTGGAPGKIFTPAQSGDAMARWPHVHWRSWRL